MSTLKKKLPKRSYTRHFTMTPNEQRLWEAKEAGLTHRQIAAKFGYSRIGSVSAILSIATHKWVTAQLIEMDKKRFGNTSLNRAHGKTCADRSIHA